MPKTAAVEETAEDLFADVFGEPPTNRVPEPTSEPVVIHLPDGVNTNQRTQPAPRARREARVVQSSDFGNMKAYRYRDVLNEAHHYGFLGFDVRSVETTQTMDKNGQMQTCAVVVVVAHFADGFKTTGVGDATRENCNKNVGAHLHRMAETRAKARALGDALNLDANFVDEFGDEDDVVPSRPAPKPATQSRASAPSNQSNRPANSRSSNGNLPDPGPGPYFCAVCGGEIVGTGKGDGTAGNASAQWKAAKSLEQYGEIRCFNNRHVN